MQIDTTHVRSAILAAAIASLAACSAPDEDGLLQHPYLHKQPQPTAAEWGYSGDIGPEHWGDLSPDYVLARTGRQQSPIDISSAATEKLPAIEFDYRPALINLIYNGHTVEEKEDGTSSIAVAGKQYALEQFHFHAPSEHTLDGRHTDMEMHLVHKSADGDLAVVSVMIEAGAENSAFAPIWSYLPTDTNRTRQSTVSVDVAKLLPADRGYYHYAGSFTTPPCTEGVLWMVLRTPVTLSSQQIEVFRAVINGNNRPVQPLNGRKITVSG